MTQPKPNNKKWATLLKNEKFQFFTSRGNMMMVTCESEQTILLWIRQHHRPRRCSWRRWTTFSSLFTFFFLLHHFPLLLLRVVPFNPFLQVLFFLSFFLFFFFLHLKLCFHQCLVQLSFCLFSTFRIWVEMGTCKFVFFLFMFYNLRFLFYLFCSWFLYGEIVANFKCWLFYMFEVK